MQPQGGKKNIPEIGDLSSNNFPNEIRRIELGDEGRVSQSASTTMLA